MSLFRKYLAESTKEYTVRIKTVTQLGNKEMDKIERVLKKYDVQNVTGPRKTVIQQHPIDFYNVENAEVYIVDAVLGLPASSYQLQSELKDTLNISKNYVIVRGEGDPIEHENQMYRACEEMESEAQSAEEDKASLLSTNSEYHDFEQIEPNAYGDEYNKQFVSRLASARAKVNQDYFKYENDSYVSQEMTIDTPADNGSFNDVPAGASIFGSQDGSKDQRFKPVSPSQAGDNEGPNTYRYGNYDNEHKGQKTRHYRDKYDTSKTKTRSKDLERIRK